MEEEVRDDVSKGREGKDVGRVGTQSLQGPQV